MDSWVPVLGGVAVALAAGIVAYLNTLRINTRQARLARVNAQLEELYGPLLALAESTNSAWHTFRSRHRPDDVHFFTEDSPLTDEERRAWVAWMTTVFHPTNRRSYELIVTKTHLLEDGQMPPALLTFLAHVSGYDVVTEAWRADDFRELASIVNHPGEPYLAYLRSSFSTLKQRQQRLLGHR
jgi:hypothetical protein